MLKKAFSFFIFILVLSFGLSASAYAGSEPWSKSVNRSRPEDLSVRLVTFGQGDIIPEKFGHTALWIKDKRLGYERLYNFGMFQFNGDLVPQFLSGKLRFWVDSEPVGPTFQNYKYHNRSIFSDELNLAPKKRLELAQKLADQVLPENRYYYYDHYYDNCSTRLRDLINEASDNALYESSKASSPYTLRTLTTACMQSSPLVLFTIMTWLNEDIDGKITFWDDMFLPIELQRMVKNATYPDGRPLVKDSETIYRAMYRTPLTFTNVRPWPYFFLTALIILLVTSLVALWYSSSYSLLSRICLGLIQFVCTLFFCLVGTLLVLLFFSYHVATYYNLNLLLTNPIMLFLTLCSIGIIFNSRRAFDLSQTCWTILAGTSVVALVASPFFTQDTSVPLAMLFPINVGFAIIFWVIRIMGGGYLVEKH